MNQKERIRQAIEVVQMIEAEVKRRLYPAYDDEILARHPILNSRYQTSLRNVVDVYCRMDSPHVEVTYERSATDGVAATG